MSTFHRDPRVLNRLNRVQRNSNQPRKLCQYRDFCVVRIAVNVTML
jgi:hypothetical protein